MSASLSLLRSVSLEQILGAAGWRSHNVFTSYYMHDLSIQSKDLLRLGPLVSSQTLVQADARPPSRVHVASASHAASRASHTVVRGSVRQPRHPAPSSL